MKCKCDDIASVIANVGGYYVPNFGSLDGIGWARRTSMSYITMLCGVDYIVRWAGAGATAANNGSSSTSLLKEPEQDAEDILRQSFALVGLLHETDAFFDMVSTPVQYMDTSLHTSKVHGIQAEVQKNAKNYIGILPFKPN